MTQGGANAPPPLNTALHRYNIHWVLCKFAYHPHPAHPHLIFIVKIP